MRRTSSLCLAVMLFSGAALRAQDADALRSLDARVYKPGSEAAKEAPDLVYNHLKGLRDKINLDSLKWKFDTKAEWEKLRDEKITNLKEYLGTFPPAPKSVPVHVTKTLQGEGFAIDNLIYMSRPGLWVTANLYRPNSPKAEPKSRPGILIIHSHHNPKTQGELQDMGMLWARAGCYVLIPDMLGHGERRQHGFHTEKDYDKPFKVGRQDYYFRYNSGLQLHLVGESLAGWMAWDMMRGLDMLLTKPGIDPERIALFGSVAGGGDPAGVTAALDPRIKVVAPFNFGGPQPETKFPLPENAEESFNYMGGGSWESTRNLRGTGAGGFFHWVIVASVAPRAIIHAHEFAWDKDRDPAWKRYQKIHALYGAQDKLAFTHGSGSVKGKPPESTHCNNIGLEHRKMMHPAINAWFGIKASEYSKRVTSDELKCWNEDLRLIVPEAPLHLVALNHARERQKQANLDAYLAQWKKKAAPLGVAAELALDKEDGKLPTRLVKFKSVATPVPISILTPTSGAADKTAHVVVAVAQQGRAGFLKHRADAIASLLKHGDTVVLVDLPATAETYPGEGRGRTSYATSVSMTAQMLGTSLFEMRLRALNEVLALLKEDANRAGKTLKVALWGDSFAPANDKSTRLNVPYDVNEVPKQGEPLGGMLALLTPFVSDVPIAGVYVHGGLVRYASLLDSPFLYIPHDAIEPGFLAHADFDDLAARLAPRAVKLEALIDGRNVVVEDAALGGVYARAAQAHAAAKSSFAAGVVRSSDAQLALWIDSVLHR
jgi:dienelactone hydrolase